MFSHEGRLWDSPMRHSGAANRDSHFATRDYRMSISGLDSVTPFHVASFVGHMDGGASSSVPCGRQMIVSSLLVPAIDGFHAKA